MVSVKGPQFNDFNIKSIHPSQSQVNSANADDIYDIQLEVSIPDDHTHLLQGTILSDCGCASEHYTACRCG